MTKIMLVEDDKSLREIYGVRLLAEGYDIVSAGDGEEALAVAIKERPALIITDIMMPKISGFDMLDILRSTTETRNIKVIVMTALGSDEQRTRGDQFGVDRYLVKSQVGIEDVVRTVHEVLGDKPVSAPVIPTPPIASNNPSVAPQPTAPPIAPSASNSTPTSTPRPMATPPSSQPITTAHAPQPVKPQPPRSSSTNPTALRNRVIQPLNDPNISPVNINELLDRELAREAGVDLNNRPPIVSTQEEKALVENQLNQFTPPATQPSQAIDDTNQPTNEDVAPTIQIDADGRVSMPQRPASAPQTPTRQTTVSPQLPPTPQVQSAPSPQVARSIPVQSAPSSPVQPPQPIIPPRPPASAAAPRPPMPSQPLTPSPVQQTQLPSQPTSQPNPPNSPPPPPPPVR